MRDLLPPERDLSTEDLFHRVLRDLRADDEPLGALMALHDRPTRLVVDRSVALCSSTDPYERSVGLRILRELRHSDVGDDQLWGPLEAMVIGIVRHEADPDVARWAISCLGYQATTAPAAALATVLGRADDPDRRVRFAVAAAVPHLTDDERPDPQALEALLALAEDTDADVRSYAIMGLVGDLHQRIAIIPMLEAHLVDPDEQIRRYCREALDGNED